VHAVGSSCERDVDPIVDQQAGTVAPAQLAKLTGTIQQLPGREILFSQLHRANPAL
jgi:hypothetical protein